MDKPVIGYRFHVFHIIPPEIPSFRRFPSFLQQSTHGNGLSAELDGVRSVMSENIVIKSKILI